MIGDAIAQAIIGLMILAAAAGALVALFLVYAVPWLWALAKPWLHMLTA